MRVVSVSPSSLCLWVREKRETKSWLWGAKLSQSVCRLRSVPFSRVESS